jgi:hypothetical protein
MRILPSYDSWHVVERRVLDLPNTSVSRASSESINTTSPSTSSGGSGARLNEGIRTHKSEELPTIPRELLEYLACTKQMVSKLEHCNKYRGIDIYVDPKIYIYQGPTV